jgi:hypothetical protein
LIGYVVFTVSDTGEGELVTITELEEATFEYTLQILNFSVNYPITQMLQDPDNQGKLVAF